MSAFATVDDVREAWTPQLRSDVGETELLLIDLAAGRTRLGESMLAQVYDQFGTDVPDLDDPSRLPAFFDALAALRRDGLVLAYHDRSDGGLFVTLAEMAFAGRMGLEISGTLRRTRLGPTRPPAATFSRGCSTRSLARLSK